MNRRGFLGLLAGVGAALGLRPRETPLLETKSDRDVDPQSDGRAVVETGVREYVSGHRIRAGTVLSYDAHMNLVVPAQPDDPVLGAAMHDAKKGDRVLVVKRGYGVILVSGNGGPG